MDNSWNYTGEPSHNTRHCPRCGTILPQNARFCGTCGMDQIPAGIPLQTVDTLGILDYILMFIGFSIPIVGLILMLYWSFGSSVGINRKNFARAYLIMSVISVVLSFLIVGVFSSIFTMFM